MFVIGSDGGGAQYDVVSLSVCDFVRHTLCVYVSVRIHHGKRTFRQSNSTSEMQEVRECWDISISETELVQYFSQSIWGFSCFINRSESAARKSKKNEDIVSFFMSLLGWPFDFCRDNL